MQVHIQLGSVIYGFIFARLGWYTSYILLIDCSDFRKELPTQELKNIDSFNSETKKISFTQGRPDHHEMFVSTSLGQNLYYQERTEVRLEKIETLDGVYKESKKLNGERVFWWKENKLQQQSMLTENNYIPLEELTKTTADILIYNQSKDTNLVKAIRKGIQILSCRRRIGIKQLI